MDEQETTPSTEDTNPETPAPVETPEVEETPEVVEVPVEEAPIVDPSTDVAPEDVPVVHEDNGSVGRELDHVVQQ